MADWQLRPAAPADAAALAAHMQALIAEGTLWLPLLAEELPSTAQLGKPILEFAQEDNSCWLLAWQGEQLAGTLELKGGRRTANAHIVTLGMNVAQAFRGQGLGRHLVREAQRWVTAHPGLSRIELECFAANTPAVALYTGQGFVIEGHRVDRYRLRGALHDTLHMSWRVPA